jgi:hypothetical protein
MAVATNVLNVHCIIHREYMAAVKYFKHEHAMEVLVKIVNYICSSAKTC